MKNDNNKQMKHIGVILAGGKGMRFGNELPKQFTMLGDKTIIEHSIATFQHCSSIDEIAIVIHADFIDTIKQMVQTNGYSKVTQVLGGGKERSDSSLAAINAYAASPNSDDYKMIFHDAVRPFVTIDMIENAIEALEKVNAVNVAIPATDTIMEVDTNDRLIKVPNRSYLRQAQTPQAFRLKTIKEAYRIALADKDFQATDDCGIVLKYLPNEPIQVIAGSTENIKVTYPLDMLIAEKLLEIRKK